MQAPASPCRYSITPRVVHFLSRAPYDIVVDWLDAMLSLDDYERQFPIVKLLPLLSVDDRRRAEEALAASILRLGDCDGSELWRLVPEPRLAELLWQLREDDYGWHREGLIEHIIRDRDEACAERCLLPIVEALETLTPDHRLETVTAMTPWLAAQTNGQLPCALASLPIRPSERRENQQYMIERVLLANR